MSNGIFSRAVSFDRTARRKTLLAGAASLAVVGALAAVPLVAKAPAARAEGPATAPLAQAFSFAPVVERVRPAVVSIRVKGEEPAPRREGWAETFPDMPDGSPFERFFGGPGWGRGGPGAPGGGWRHGGPRHGQTVVSQGSGFIISPKGRVVTNFHVVKNAVEVTVTTEDGAEYKAKVIGSDEKTDVALLEIKDAKADFPTVAFATAEVRPGDWVLAVGNPFGLGGSVTAGIVSARGREIGAGPYDDFLQIDAPINRGNSGGPTFDLAGNVVGMNTAIYSPSGGSVGIGFAIPAATVQKVIAQLDKGGEVVRGWLGVQIQPIGRDMVEALGLKDPRGALVAQIEDGTPAAKAGLKAGDAVTAVDGRPIKNSRDLARMVAGFEPGTKVKLTVMRDAKERTVEVELGRMPKDAKATAPDRPDEGRPALAGLGLALAPASEVGIAGGGVAVVDLDPNGAAASRGIRPGDVLLEVQGRTVATVADVSEAVAAARGEGRRAVLVRLRTADGIRFVPLPLVGS